MHVHMKPILTPAAPTPAKPAKADPAQRSDLEALLATAKDRRGGSGSRPRRQPGGERPEDEARVTAPTTSLAVLLTEMALDARAGRDDVSA